MSAAQVCRPGRIRWAPYRLKDGCVAQEFLIYVLAAFLLTWSDQLRTMEFQDLVMYLQASACASSATLSWLCQSHAAVSGSHRVLITQMTGSLGRVKHLQLAPT